MNRTLVIVAAAAAFVAAARADQEVDVNIGVAGGGQVVTTGGTYSTGPYAGRVFEGTFGLSGTSTSNPGFFAPAGTFPLYSAAPPFVGLRMDFVRELLFWDGTQLAAPNSPVTVRRSTRSATISGTDTGGKPGILIDNIPADRGYHTHAFFDIQPGAATGLYGLVFTLGPNVNGATTGFTTSEPILVTLARGGVANYDQGVASLAAAAFVPEPASLALVGMGGGSLIGAALLRRRRRRTARALAAAAVFAFTALAVTPARAEVWTLGHGDIGVAYHPAESTTGFEMEVHLETGAVVSGSSVTEPAGVAYAPGDAAIRVPATANLRAIQSGSTAVWGGDATGYNFVAMGATLGVGQGADLWVLSFSDFDAGFYQTPYLGWATEEGFAGENFSAVTFRPVSFSGPGGGSMGVFDESLTPLWVILSGEGTFDGDAFTVPADDHVHKVVAFTQPGTYLVGIEASATHPTHGAVTGQATYIFQVVPEPSAWVIAGGAAAGLLVLRRRRVHGGAPPPDERE